MATENDSGGLVDRRSLRELAAQAVGGRDAPLSAKAQLKNTKKLRKLGAEEKKRLKKLLAERMAKK